MSLPERRLSQQVGLPKGDRERDRTLQDLLQRSIRTESRLSQLMLHMGMTSDGRKTLQQRGEQT